MDVVDDLQKRIEESAIVWGNALREGKHRTANKHNSAITKIAKKFKKDKNLGASVLIPLLKHPEPSVRLLASVHSLELGIQVQESESILTKIADDPSIKIIRLMAQINLSEWKKKKKAQLK